MKGLDRTIIDAVDPALNAFCFRDDDAAMAAARESEARWAEGAPLGLVDGVPTTIKDQTLATGWPTRRGSLTMTDHRAEEDAPVVARLREHGAVLRVGHGLARDEKRTKSEQSGNDETMGHRDGVYQINP